MSLSRYETTRYPRKRRFRENIFYGKSPGSLVKSREYSAGYVACAKTWLILREIYRMIANEETANEKTIEAPVWDNVRESPSTRRDI